jgi:dCTP deaminase
MGNPFITEIARSHIEIELSKLQRLHTQDLPVTLLNVSHKLAEYLRSLLTLERQDQYDLQLLFADLRVTAEISQLLTILTKDRSSWWAESLIKECYERLGISLEQREIILIHDDQASDFLSYPNVFGELPKHMGISIDQKVDIFLLPMKARQDLASIALIAHEVGHVYFQEYRQKLLENLDILWRTGEVFQLIGSAGREVCIQFPERLDPLPAPWGRGSSFGFAQDMPDCEARETPTLPGGSERLRWDQRSAEHIEEYIADSIGRFLMGPAFDFALIKELYPLQGNHQGCNKDSIESIRVRLSYAHLRNLSEQAEARSLASLSHILKRIIDGWSDLIGTCYQEKLTTDELMAFDWVQKLLQDEQIKPPNWLAEIEFIWDLVTPELVSFRPPFERVDRNRPQAISPIQAVIGTVLYYYGEHFRQAGGNEYFEYSKQPEIEKLAVLRHRLVEHLIYAISLSEFVKCAQSGMQELDFASDKLGESTLWSMRDDLTSNRLSLLTVTPSIDPINQYGDNAIDLRLGPCFLIHQPSRYTHLEPNPEKNGQVQDYLASVGSFYTEINVPVGREFILHPHQFVLASILEYVCLPYHYYALVLGRSTWGRLGLNIATATTVQAGYRGCLTLELRNLGETPLPLTVGTRIAQLCLIKVPHEGKEKGYFVAGTKYVGPVKPEVPLIYADKDWALLNSMAKR